MKGDRRRDAHKVVIKKIKVAYTEIESEAAKVGTIPPEQKGGPRGNMGRGVGMKNADGLTGNLKGG